jgi:hypothetical protein
MTEPTTRAATRRRKSNDKQHQAALQISTRQIARDAVRGGAKTEKKNKRSGVGRAQKG